MDVGHVGHPQLVAERRDHGKKALHDVKEDVGEEDLLASASDGSRDLGTELLPGTQAKVTMAKVVKQSLNFIGFDGEVVPNGVRHAAHQLGSKFGMSPETSENKQTITVLI